MKHSFRILLISLCLIFGTMLYAEPLSEQARISLLTCTPGADLYARYGHTAIRVLDPTNELDVVFNYGTFDFNTDHFYWKFVRGETWYELGASPYYWFMQGYGDKNRSVYEQVLNVNAEQREALWQALLNNYRPENRKYLYNFVFDNCATRPYVLIAKVLGDTIISDYKGYTGVSYRSFIRHYTGKYTWANFGINLLFGPKADKPMNSEQRLFLPEELMNYIQQAHLSNGKPLVSQGSIAPFVISSTPWYASWPFGLAMYFIVICIVSFIDRKRQKLSSWVDWIFCILFGLLLVLVTFLTFFSCHPLVGFGWRLLILPMTHLCARFIYILR